MGHSGAADWSWAQKAKAVVSMPVFVNGDVKTADDAERALAETGCDGVMIGRRAIEHPWVFREVRARLDHGATTPAPTTAERIEVCLSHLAANVEERGERRGVAVTRRHLSGYLRGLPGAAALRQALVVCDSHEGCIEILQGARQRAA